MRSLIIAAALATASGKILKAENGELIANEYIVVLRANSTKADRESHIALHGADAHVIATYDSVFNGYAVRTSEHVMERLSEHPDVEYVEQNQVARALQQCLPPTANPPEGLWGLSRVSYNAIQLPRRNVRRHAGAHANVYIMDTGINYPHNDFGGRASFAFDATGEGPNDGNGHGTHCAGTAAGASFGIARESHIFDVKVLNRQGSGTFAGVINGIDFSNGRANAQHRVVGSLSLGGGFSQAVNDAVNRLSNNPHGIASVASGNSNTNACNTSPASAANGVTVNALANNDARAGFSNFGTCTHIFAPGQNVLSAWIGSNTATNTISGTSMACPHVTGILADAWIAQTGMTGQQLKAHIINRALEGRVTNPGAGSPNRLAQTLCAE
jgi:subtilisin family serine protease